MNKPATKPANEYPGVDVNNGDDNKVDKKLVKQEIRELNNNPRNNDLDE